MGSLKIQYASDLHLEFPENKAFIQKNPLQAVGDILLLAGDIVPFAVMDKHQDFFNYISDNFEMTYWIPGNHEYYYYDALNKSGSFQEKIRENIILLNNTAIQINKTKFLFSTLWSKINPANQWVLENGHSDFHLIKYNNNKFGAAIYNQFHENCIAFLNKELQINNLEKTIVCTHHVPTFKNYPEIYKNSTINEGFAVELFDTIEASKIDYWIYGHSHFNTKDFTIGSTNMITNQLGYIQRKENELFQNQKYFIL